MADTKIRLEYADVGRPIFIPKLKYHPGGVTLPNDTNIITVTEGEAKNFLRLKNGSDPCFKEVKEAPARRRAAEADKEE